MTLEELLATSGANPPARQLTFADMLTAGAAPADPLGVGSLLQRLMQNLSSRGNGPPLSQRPRPPQVRAYTGSRPLSEMSDAEVAAMPQDLSATEMYRRMRAGEHQPRQLESGDGGPPVWGTPSAPPALALPSNDGAVLLPPPAPPQDQANAVATVAPQAPPGEQPAAPAPAPAQPAAASTAGGGVPVAGPGGRPTLADIPQPNYDRVLDLFMQSRPQDYNPPPERIWQMALLGALGNLQFQPGERLGFGLARAIPGGAQGAMQESQLQEARRRETGREQRDFQRGLAGLVGGQEDARYGRAVQARVFDRDTRHQERELGLRGAGLRLQEQDLALRREQLAAAQQGQLLTRMIQAERLRTMLQRQGLSQDETAVISSGVEEIARGGLTFGGFTVPVPGANGQVQQVPVAQALGIIQQNLMRSPQAAGLLAVPRAFENASQLTLNELIAQRLAELRTSNPEQYRRILRAMAARNERRPAAGTGVEMDE